MEDAKGFMILPFSELVPGCAAARRMREFVDAWNFIAAVQYKPTGSIVAFQSAMTVICMLNVLRVL